MSKETSTNLVWARVQPGYKIIALTEPYYSQVLYLISNHYFSSDIITNVTKISEDEISSEKFFEHILCLLDEERSIALIEENTQNIIAILILSTVTKHNFHKVHSRENLKNGLAYNKYIELKTALNKQTDIFVDYDCDIFMRFYLLCIDGDYLNTNFGYNMLRCGIEVCRAYNLPIACGIFPNPEFQKCAQLVGFTVAHKINYSEWSDMINCDDEQNENCGCCLMVAKVQPPVPPIIAEDVVVTKKPKKDKGDKKGKKKKK